MTLLLLLLLLLMMMLMMMLMMLMLMMMMMMLMMMMLLLLLLKTTQKDANFPLLRRKEAILRTMNTKLNYSKRCQLSSSSEKRGNTVVVDDDDDDETDHCLLICVCVSCSQLAVRCWIVHSTCVSLETIRNLYATRFEVGTWRHCCVSSTALWKNSSNTILDKKTGSVSWRLHQCDRFSVFVC